MQPGACFEVQESSSGENAIITQIGKPAVIILRAGRETTKAHARAKVGDVNEGPHGSSGCWPVALLRTPVGTEGSGLRLILAGDAAHV